MREKDFEIDNILNSMGRLKQRQYSLRHQLYYLCKLANFFGLYDAEDYLKTNMAHKGIS